MRYFLAKNPKQLDICLRLLYAEHIPFSVQIVETEKRRIVYNIFAMTDDQTMLQLEEKYRILIS